MYISLDQDIEQQEEEEEEEEAEEEGEGFADSIDSAEERFRYLRP